MKGLCRLFVAVKMVSQIKNRKNKVSGGKKKRREGGARGEGQQREGGKHAKFSLPEENLNGFGWGLVQPQPCCTYTGGGE